MFKKMIMPVVIVSLGLTVVTNATVTFVGNDTVTKSDWRTAAALESDNEYGTDGYAIYGFNEADGAYNCDYDISTANANNLISLPAYISDISLAGNSCMWSGNGNFGQIEDPANGNALSNTPLLANGDADPWVFTMTRSTTTGFRLTVMLSNGDNAPSNWITTVDSGGSALHDFMVPDTSSGTYYEVFDIPSGSGPVTVTVEYVPGGSQFNVTGFAFDSPSELASNPKPGDGQVDVLRDVVLNWSPGRFAVKHDVYLGTSFDDVSQAERANPSEVLISQGQDANSLDLGRLPFGQTYYWRVDEVNGLPDNTVFAGDVWSFTVEPFAIPIETITATASSSNADDMGPEKTIDGSGLDELDQHNTEPGHMWLSAARDPNVWIQYAFDKTYKLHEMQVWNSNQRIEAFVGLGLKDVVIEVSVNGTDWTPLENVPQFAQASGTETYAANTTVEFGGVQAQYVRISVVNGHGPLGQYGLSEVRFLAIPTLPREPEPADGVTIEGVDVVLTWRAGREADSHQVYLGTTADDLALLDAIDENTFTAANLDYDQSYFWQIVEVNEAEVPATYAGPVWRFTTPAYAVVDDFESYDDNCQRIFFAWEDGLGHNGGLDIEDCAVPPSNGNGGGSIVGNESSPFAERTLVHSGGQSMPLSYDNNFGPSETTLQLEAQDWSTSGIKSLSVYFRGTAGNTGQLYVKINNTKVSYNGDAADIAGSVWLPWIIELSTVGANLQSVTSLTFGVDGAGAAGKLYIDDVRLYPLAPGFVTPTEPDNAGLVAAYSLDGDATDGSGNGHDGVIEGSVAFSAGVTGLASDHNGSDALINCGDIPVSDAGALSVAFWVQPRNIAQDWAGYVSKWTSDDAERTFWLGQHATDGWLRFGIYPSGPAAETAVDSGQVILMNEEWTHIACTHDGNVQRIYAQGMVVVASAPRNAGIVDRGGELRIGKVASANWFDGLIDEVWIYNRALALEEIAWLAGKTAPIVKPF